MLDLACGTGDILFERGAARRRSAVGLDVTHRMLQLAARDACAGAGGPSARLTGDMLALPFRPTPSRSSRPATACAMCPDLAAVDREIRRVLAPGGRLLSLDFNRPGNPFVRACYLAYLTVVGSALGFVLHRDPNTYRYIPESIRNYPGAARRGGDARSSAGSRTSG